MQSRLTGSDLHPLIGMIRWRGRTCLCVFAKRQKSALAKKGLALSLVIAPFAANPRGAAQRDSNFSETRPDSTVERYPIIVRATKDTHASRRPYLHVLLGATHTWSRWHTSPPTRLDSLQIRLRLTLLCLFPALQTSSISRDRQHPQHIEAPTRHWQSDIHGSR